MHLTSILQVPQFLYSHYLNIEPDVYMSNGVFQSEYPSIILFFKLAYVSYGIKSSMHNMKFHRTMRKFHLFILFWCYFFHSYEFFLIKLIIIHSYNDKYMKANTQYRYSQCKFMFNKLGIRVGVGNHNLLLIYLEQFRSS